MDLPFTIEPTWKQHLCYEALNTVVLDPDHLDPKDPDYGPLTVEVFFGGGADGGKSWAICESRLINAYKYPGYKSFIGRHELKRLMQSTYITWLEVCRYHKIPREEWKLDGQMHVIRFANGSAIDLLDLSYRPTEDPLYERFGSLPYSDGAIEEAGEVHPLAREVLKSRCGRWLNQEQGINPSLLATGNPKKNWTYHLFYKPSTKGELPPDRKFIQALHKDNKYGQKAYGKNLDRITDPIMRARLRDGNWEYEDDPSALINYAAIADLFTNHIADDEDDTSSDRYMTVDVSRYGKDKIVVTLWRGWFAYKILWREKQGTDITAQWLKSLAYEEEIPYSHVLIDEDGIGGGVIDQMRGVRGFLANGTPIEQLDEDDDDLPEKKRAFANVKTQCAYVLADKVNTHQVRVECIDTRIRDWLIADLEQIKEQHIDSEGKRSLVPKEETKIVLGRSPDFGDTFIMRALFDLKPPKKETKTWQFKPKMR
jgi:hypothetical protein